jgi:manganese/zinc/iron transport system substrate-binding protein
VSQIAYGVPIKVVATTPQIAEAVERLAGSNVEVRALVSPGIDPHTFKATPSDVAAIKQADLILYSGLHLEAQMEKIFETQRKVKNVVAVSHSIAKDKLIPDPGQKGYFDPHFWHDVTLWQQAVVATKEALIMADKRNAALYTKNADAYLKKLDRLQADVVQGLEKIPAPTRFLVTIHDAFSYFARQYGFKVENIQGVNTESAASIADVKRVTDFISRNKIPAMFLENSTPTRNAQAIIEGAKANGWNVILAGTLYADGPGEKGSAAGTYEGMMMANVNTIVSALAPKQN